MFDAEKLALSPYYLNPRRLEVMGATEIGAAAQRPLFTKPVSAAFLLKGPSVRGEMHPNNLGKRGDQLMRAFDEPVDLVVVQHCNKIANTVVRQAEALAYDPRHPRRYCILDGADTAVILRAHGKLT